MNEEKAKKPEDLTLLDQLLIQNKLDQKLNQSEGVDTKDNLILSNEIIEKVIHFCTQEIMNLKDSINWSKRAEVNHFFDNLKRLYKTLIQTLSLTSGKEDLLHQADRFQKPMQKFMTLYALTLEEAEKHQDTLDSVLQIPIVTESDLKEYQLVLEDDIMQDILSINHLILELLKKDPETHEKVKEILRDY